MKPKELQQELENIDIYLLDQILKGKIKTDAKILDAGCGNGRNCHYLLKNGFDVTGIDINSKAIIGLQETYSSTSFIKATLLDIPFNSEKFDYIICNAVLHFSENTLQFLSQFTELLRVLKPNGTLFIRMTSDIGIEKLVKEIKNGVYQIPDGTTRFLLTEELLNKLMLDFPIQFTEPLKTVNVNNLRAMSTLVFMKK